MDRLAQIKQRRRGKRILAAMLGNALPLFLSLYGLKCILTLYGKLTEPSKFVMGSFHLVPVKGMAAVMAGLGYLSLALFGYLSWGPPPDEDRPRIWRFMRSVIRWGSLPALWGFWHEAHQMRLSNPNGGFLDSLPDIKTSADVRAYVLVAIAFSIVGVLWLLGAMWRREWVKTDLCERICKPISIRWRPLTYWAPAMPIFSGPAFKVAYLDPEGRLHKAYCYTSNLQSRRVTWIKDEVRDFIDV